MEEVAFGKKGEETLVIELMRIGMNQPMELLGCRQAGNPKPEPHHQDDCGDPMWGAPWRRNVSCLQDTSIKHRFKA